MVKEELLSEEIAFMEQTVKAIKHYEQKRSEGPHVARIIELLHSSLADSKARIKSITPQTETKYGKPYMEK